jgi:hypothetical protein
VAQEQILGREAFDVVDIAEGLRDLASVVATFPDGNPLMQYPAVPVPLVVPVESVDAVAAWALNLGVPVESWTAPTGFVHVSAAREFGAVEFKVFYIVEPVRTLMRPSGVTEAFEAVEVA